MASNDIYQHYNFSLELMNIDKSVEKMDEQLNVITKEIEKLGKMGAELKAHQTLHKDVWKQHNLEKFKNILVKAKNIDNILNQNFQI